jgi:hypothetical protein
MLSDELLDFAAGRIADERKEVLKQSFGSTITGLRKVYEIGVEIQCDSRRSSLSDYQILFDQIRTDLVLNEADDFELVDFLACFELGFASELEPIAERRKQLKLMCASVVFAVHRFPPPESRGKGIQHLSEGTCFDLLSEAQEARWRCDFDIYDELIADLESRIRYSSLGRAAKNYWYSNLGDLKVETSFTISRTEFSEAGLQAADDAIFSWGNQRNFEKLTHAYLRKTVLLRQRSLMVSDGSQPLHAALATLLEAEQEVGRQLAAIGNEVLSAAAFSLYVELAKANAQIANFSKAWEFYRLAARRLEGVGAAYHRRRLDLVRCEAVILAEQNCVRNFSEINRVERCINEMNSAISIADIAYSNDRVLREILVKDLIPLMAIVGGAGKSQFKEEAYALLGSCQDKAISLNLFHQQRGLKYIQNKFFR